MLYLAYILCRNTVTFAENACVGEGANREKRVKWVKKLSRKDLKFFVESKDFINKDMWLEKLPISHIQGRNFFALSR